eukprot:TRINITY_DN1249_c0_g1_i2.p1 TRINITY_DN1249_c0_g1~~TRINITY_DN1249_c0_g1_i2.p1  ORF type:complete len:516 (-),score=88.67 TRINITY_DN1249_c0_g1_i2:89-1636(-)
MDPYFSKVITRELWDSGKPLGEGTNGKVRLVTPVTLKGTLSFAVKQVMSVKLSKWSKREIDLHKEAHKHKLSVPYFGEVHRTRSYVIMAPLDSKFPTLDDYLEGLEGEHAEIFSMTRITLCLQLVMLLTGLFKNCKIVIRDLKPDNIGWFKGHLVHMDFGNGRRITFQRTKSKQCGADVIAAPEASQKGSHEYAYEDRWALGANIMYILSGEWAGERKDESGENHSESEADDSESEADDNESEADDKKPSVDHDVMIETAKIYADKLRKTFSSTLLGDILEGLVKKDGKERIDIVKLLSSDSTFRMLFEASQKSRSNAIDNYMSKMVPNIEAHRVQLLRQEMKELAIAKKVATKITKAPASEKKVKEQPVKKKAIRKKAENSSEEDEPEVSPVIKKRNATPIPAKQKKVAFEEEDSDDDNESFSSGSEDDEVWTPPAASRRKTQTAKIVQTEPVKRVTRREAPIIPFKLDTVKADKKKAEVSLLPARKIDLEEADPRPPAKVPKSWLSGKRCGKA